MKQRVIALLLALLLLTASFVTAVFAEPDEDDTAEDLAPAAETTNHDFAPETTAAEAPEPVQPSSEPAPSETESVITETEAPVTEPETEPTEPSPEPGPAPEAEGNRLTLRAEGTDLNRDLLFLIRGEDLSLQAVLPAGASRVTVVGLPAGSYTVALDRDWNWLVELGEEEAEQTVSFSGTRESRTVTFRPEAGPVSWLNASAGGDGK